MMMYKSFLCGLEEEDIYECLETLTFYVAQLLINLVSFVVSVFLCASSS